MPSNNPQFTLRFRTKKQQAEMRRLAKGLKFSLNEFIIRMLESKQEEFDRHESNQSLYAEQSQ